MRREEEKKSFECPIVIYMVDSLENISLLFVFAGMAEEVKMASL